MAFTPYVAAASLPVLLFAVARRRWRSAVVAVAVTAALTASVLPRALADGGGTTSAGGATLKVLTSNVYVGNANPTDLVALVREQDVDLLAVQELTCEFETALLDAGIAGLLPYRATNPRAGASGTGIFTRWEIMDTLARPLTSFEFVQTEVTLAVPASPSTLVTVESAHPNAPYAPGMDRIWEADLALQPEADPDGTPRVLLGDFNSTLDHALLRSLIATGYRDAAAAVGKGLTPTWPNDDQLIPGVTLDHVLADQRMGIQGVSIHDVPGSDHRAVFAELTLPSSS